MQTELSVYFSGQDDDLTRVPLRQVAAGESTAPAMPERKIIQLRDYQQAATDNCLRDLETHRSSLIVLATGLGKTILFCKLVQQWKGRVLVLAHLEELLQNARDDLMAITGEPVGIERARDTHEGERIVVGLIQSVSKRLHRFDPKHFSLIIIDEAHHAASDAYLRVLDHFSPAKYVGLTATDSRADGEALPFDSEAYRMGILEGINQGYLVPVRGRRIVIESLDLSKVKRKNDGKGDFDESALDDVMVQNVTAIVDVLVDDYPWEKGILFFPGCASAKFTCERLNAKEPNSAVYIDGNITGIERRELIAKLRNGEARWLCNVGIATEGFNWPEASVVGMCSPTLSRPAYVQRVGRGTRPLAGLLNGLSTAADRKRAIANSNKPSMLILDFQGVSANLDLISHESFLDETKPKLEAEPEKESSGADDTDPGSEEDFSDDDEGALGDSRINLKSLAAGIQSRTVHSSEEFDPFAATGGAAQRLELKSELGKEPSITHKQLKCLSRYGITDESLTRAEAGKLMGYLSQNGFKLWGPQIGILKKLYKDIISQRAIKVEEEDFR